MGKRILNPTGAGKTLRECPVSQYTVQGKLIQHWPSLAQAASGLQVDHRRIIKAAREDRLAANSRWSFTKYSALSGFRRANWPIELTGYDEHKNNLIKAESLNQAIRLMSLKPGNTGTLSRCLRNNKKAFSYTWHPTFF